MMFDTMAKPSPFARTSAMTSWARSPDTDDRGALQGIARSTQRNADREVEGAFGVSQKEKDLHMGGRFRVGERVKGAPNGFKIKAGQYGTVTKKEKAASGAIAYMVKLDGGGEVRVLDSELVRGSKPGY